MLNLICFMSWFAWAVYMGLASADVIPNVHVNYWFVGLMAFFLAFAALRDFVRGE